MSNVIDYVADYNFCDVIWNLGLQLTIILIID